LALGAKVPTRLVAVGGLSGSGKSTVAASIAPLLGPVPGARILATDRIRKSLFGAAAETRLPPEAYRSEISERVYALLAERAALVLRQGYAAVADAVHDRAEDRARIVAVAGQAKVPFDGLWLQAPLETLLARVSSRRGGPSDATPDVVRAQARRAPATTNWTEIPAAQERGALCAAARLALQPLF
jgi:predicted kinase